LLVAISQKLMILIHNEFDTLCANVAQCSLCSRMSNSKRVLSRASGALDAEIMFIGEAPGRLGADGSEIPFHGDKSGHNFEGLLDFASLNRSKIFVTNAVLCNPKDDKGNNATPNKLEVLNCSRNLRDQIDTLQPKIVVPLGATALESLRLIENHNLTLKHSVRTANKWYNRTLIPLYHPGQRAMLHRSLANQRSDYQFIADFIKKTKKQPLTVSASMHSDISSIVRYILTKIGIISYFSLHKIFYLIELDFFKLFGHRLTSAYIIRQKDGPYVVDLHMHKLKNNIYDLIIFNKNNISFLKLEDSLFKESEMDLDEKIKNLIDNIVTSTASKSQSELKTKVYMTTPMRKLLKIEQENGLNLYNTPIDFNFLLSDNK